jgi:squalene synthase HpnC
MSDIEALASGKGHADENFPVASALIAPRHRPVVMAFYRVARLSDDVADHPALSPSEKLDWLEAIEASLLGESASVAAAAELRTTLAERQITDRHMRDLLVAFRRDAVKARYASWAELMDYCRYSAAPVGRFVLDVHGEPRSTWRSSDALCAALQVINHLQDCGKDYRDLDRVYIPLDALSRVGLDARALGAAKGGEGLGAVIAALSSRTEELLRTARPLASQVRDLRLALEIGAINSLANDLNRRLRVRDPLSRRTRHGRVEMLGLGMAGVVATLWTRLSGRRNPAP